MRSMTILAKICGVTTMEAVEASIEAGAAYLGFVFFPRSPRHLKLDQAARLAEPARGRARVVALIVDADDAEIERIHETVRPDLFQLHGSETPERAAEVRELTGAGVIKALPVSSAEDLDAAEAWCDAVDHLMLDARPPRNADRPGGMGHSFDWSLLQGRDLGRSWFLAGGLTPDNVADAVRITGAPMVDVSSGVESAPGVKDPALIRAFLARAKATSPKA